MTGTFVEIPPPAVAGGGISGGRTGGPEAHRPLVRRLLAAAPPYLYLAPAIACLVIWFYRPLFQTVELSIYQWDLLPTTPMVPEGLSNYRSLLGEPPFWQSIWLTALFILGMIPFSVILPTVVALRTRRVRGRMRAVYQGLIFAPFLISPIASAVLWEWILDPRFGVLDRAFGMSTNWLGETHPAQLAIVAITGWGFMGFAVLIVSAGLSGQNDEYEAAAQLDGASRWQITRRITLPLLSPTLVFLTLMTVLLSSQLTFPLINALTQGGPGTATTNIYYLLWEDGFKTFNAGLGAAAGVIYFIGFGAVALLLVWLSERLSFHDN